MLLPAAPSSSATNSPRFIAPPPKPMIMGHRASQQKRPAYVRYGSLATGRYASRCCRMSASLQKRTIRQTCRYVRLVPCVDGSELARVFFTFAGWSVQPCVRPVSAAHKAAGHNALRGSGPGQKPAFEMHWHKWVVLIAGSTGSALRAVRPSNLHITPDVDAISVTPRVRRVPCSDHPWPSWPTPFLQSCWRARSQRPWWAAVPTMP
jgi:hypothetical protein